MADQSVKRFSILARGDQPPAPAPKHPVGGVDALIGKIEGRHALAAMVAEYDAEKAVRIAAEEGARAAQAEREAERAARVAAENQATADRQALAESSRVSSTELATLRTSYADLETRLRVEIADLQTKVSVADERVLAANNLVAAAEARAAAAEKRLTERPVIHVPVATKPAPTVAAPPAPAPRQPAEYVFDIHKDEFGMPARVVMKRKTH